MLSELYSCQYLIKHDGAVNASPLHQLFLATRVESDVVSQVVDYSCNTQNIIQCLLCVRACMHAYMHTCVCMYVCVCACVRMHARTHTHTCVCAINASVGHSESN